MGCWRRRKKGPEEPPVLGTKGGPGVAPGDEDWDDSFLLGGDPSRGDDEEGGVPEGE